MWITNGKFFDGRCLFSPDSNKTRFDQISSFTLIHSLTLSIKSKPIFSALFANYFPNQTTNFSIKFPLLWPNDDQIHHSAAAVFRRRATVALYCYYSDYAADAVDVGYEECGWNCFISYFEHRGHTKIYQGCGNCSKAGNKIPLPRECDECGDHLCNEGKKQSFEQLMKAMDLWEEVRDDPVLRSMPENYLGMLRLMHKLAMQDVLGKLVQKSRQSIGDLFGMRTAMKILFENPSVFAKLADNPKKLRFLVWNQAEFERKLKHLEELEKWLEK